VSEENKQEAQQTNNGFGRKKKESRKHISTNN